MRVSFIGATILILAGAAGAPAHAADNAVDGFKVGGSLDYRRNEAKYPVTALGGVVDKQEGGPGFRIHAGYDIAVGDHVLIGAEGGLGGGGKTLEQRTAGGDYRLKPGLSYDASVRLGLLASSHLLIYGRAGYHWLKTEEGVKPTVGPALRDRKKTEGGVMYGFGAEYAVTESMLIRAEFDQTNFGHGLKAAQVQLGGAVRF